MAKSKSKVRQQKLSEPTPDLPPATIPEVAGMVRPLNHVMINTEPLNGSHHLPTQYQSKAHYNNEHTKWPKWIVMCKADHDYLYCNSRQFMIQAKSDLPTNIIVTDKQR
jgi:hypothetical protein